jgi:trehalose utilization protein
MIRVTVWGENVHERKNKVVAGIYPDGMHGTIAAAPSPCRTPSTG